MATARADGDLDQAMAGGRLVEAVYEVPHQAHAPMEPLNCTAQVAADRVDVWMGTQNPEAALQLAARTAGVPPGQVFVPQLLPGRRLRPARGQ